MNSKAIFFFVASILLQLLNFSSSVEEFEETLKQNCGTVDSNLSDVRILAPWTAAIYIRDNANSPFRFLTAGIVSTPTVISASFRGILGNFSGVENINKVYKLPNPNNILVGLGLNCTDLEKCKDEHSVLSKVAKIHPYDGVHESWKTFHVALLHLEQPILFTQYVKPPCPILPKDLQGISYDFLRHNIPGNLTSFLTGFAAKNGETLNTKYLTRLEVRIVSTDECELQYFKRYKKKMPEPFSCARILPNSKGTTPFCMLHNSLRIDTLFGTKSRAYGTGTVTLIPGFKSNKCSPSTYYFLYLTSGYEKDWILKSLKCSPKFTCTKSGECIDWTHVCNSRKNCEHEEDENPKLCSVIS